MTNKRPNGAVDQRAESESRIAAELRSINSQNDSIGRSFATAHGIGTTDLHALLHVMLAETAGKPLTPSDVSDRLGISNAAVTHLVDRLLESGHLRREPDLKDRRKVILRYEDRGMEVARDFFAPLRQHMHTAFAEFSDAELETAHRVLAATSSALDSFQSELSERAPQPRLHSATSMVSAPDRPAPHK